MHGVTNEVIAYMINIRCHNIQSIKPLRTRGIDGAARGNMFFRSPHSGLEDDLGLVEGLDLGVQSLALGGLATDRAESLDAQSLAGLGGGDTPGGDLLAGGGLLAGSGLLGGHDLSGLALLQVGLLQATGGLGLGALEDGDLGALALGDGGLLHGHLLHAHLLIFFW